MSGPATGRHLADGLSRMIADTVIKARAATAEGETVLKHKGQTSYLEQLEREMAPHIKSAFGWILDEPNAPDFLRVIVQEASDPGHQFAAFQQIIMFMSFILSGAFKMGEPLVQLMMNDLWAHNPSMPLSPQEAALAVLKGWMDQPSGAAEAIKSGVNAATFDHMVKINGNPPGPEELLSLHRRGIIDIGRMQKGILESHIRPEWFDTYVARFNDPMEPAEAIAAAVQSQLSVDEARKIAGMGGMSGDDFTTLYKTHGNPPGPHEIGEMLHRGLISLPDAQQAIRESRIKNKYVDAMLAMTRRLPPERSVVMMVAHGAITQADGIARLVKLGFAQEDAAALTNEAMNRKHSVSRNLAQTQILELVEQGAISEAAAAAMFKDLGFDPQEAAWLIMLANTRRERHFQETAIAKVHSLYVGHHIERDKASNDLDRLHVPTPQRDHLIALWDLERESNVTHLTLAQLGSAYNSEWISKGDFTRELTRMGYSAFAQGILEARYRPVSPTGKIGLP